MEQPYFRLLGPFGGGGLSNIGVSADLLKIDLEMESLEKVVAIVEERLRTERRSSRTAVIGESNLVPSSFLQTGAKQSLAVCRIVRYFSLKGFQDFLQEVEKEIKSRGGVNPFTNINEVKEIFGIPDEIAKDIRDFEQGKDLIKALKDNLNESQLAKINPIAWGTGFLVGGNHILTNAHVIPDEKTAKGCIAQFNYVEDASGYISSCIDYELDPDLLFVSEPTLDYTLVQLRSNSLTPQAGYQFGWIQLTETDTSIKPGIHWLEIYGRKPASSVFDSELGKAAIARLAKNGYIVSIGQFPEGEALIIWHPDSGHPDPKGKYTRETETAPICNENYIELIKEDVRALEQLVEARLAQERKEDGEPVFIVQYPKGEQQQIVVGDNNVILDGLFKDVLRYKADVDYGSSGSLVCNARWELIALNHAAIFPEPAGISSPPIAEQGIRTCRIVEDLKRKSFDKPKLKSFLEDFVVTTEQLSYPNLLSALEFNGVNSYVVLDNFVAFISLTDSNNINFWNRNGIQLNALSFGNELIESYDISPDGSKIVTGTRNGLVKLWSVDGKELKVFQEQYIDEPNLPVVASFSPDGKTITSARSDGLIRFLPFDLSITDSHCVKLEASHSMAASTNNYKIRGLKFSPDGKTIAGISSDNQCCLWQLCDGKLISSLQDEGKDSGALHGRTTCVNFSRDGKIVATGHYGLIKLWNLDGTKRCSLTHGRSMADAVNAISFSQERIATASTDGTVKLWGLDGTPLPVILEQEARFVSVDFSPDGQTLITGSGSKSLTIDDEETYTLSCVQIWNLNGDLLTTLPGAGHTVKFTPVSPRHSSSSTSCIFDASEITIEAWLCAYPNLSINTVSASTNTIITNGTFTLSIRGGSIEFCLHSDDGNEYRYSTDSLYSVPSNRFIHLAVTYNGRSVAFYVDGEEQNPSEFNPITSVPLSLNNSKIPILIGAALRKSKSGNIEYQTMGKTFKGLIAEVRLWDVVQSLDDIRNNQHRHLKSDEHGLVGYWQLGNVKAGQDIARVETRLSKATEYPALPLPFGLQFSAQKDFVSCVEDLDLTVVNAAITIEAWVKHKFGNCLILSQGDLSGSCYLIELQDSRLRVTLQDENIIEKIVVDTEDVFPQSQTWHHIAFTWEQSSSEISIYIDGRVQNSVVISGYSKTISTPRKHQTYGLFTASLDRIASNLNIGGQPAQLNLQEELQSSKFYDVVISDVRIWNVCRPQDKIKANMSRRLNSSEEKANGLIGYWRLDEGNGDNVTNLVSGETGTIHGAKWFPAPRKE